MDADGVTSYEFGSEPAPVRPASADWFQELFPSVADLASSPLSDGSVRRLPSSGHVHRVCVGERPREDDPLLLLHDEGFVASQEPGRLLLVIDQAIRNILVSDPKSIQYQFQSLLTALGKITIAPSKPLHGELHPLTLTSVLAAQKSAGLSERLLYIAGKGRASARELFLQSGLWKRFGDGFDQLTGLSLLCLEEWEEVELRSLDPRAFRALVDTLLCNEEHKKLLATAARNVVAVLEKSSDARRHYEIVVLGELYRLTPDPKWQVHWLCKACVAHRAKEALVRAASLANEHGGEAQNELLRFLIPHELYRLSGDQQEQLKVLSPFQSDEAVSALIARLKADCRGASDTLEDLETLQRQGIFRSPQELVRHWEAAEPHLAKPKAKKLLKSMLNGRVGRGAKLGPEVAALETLLAKLRAHDETETEARLCEQRLARARQAWAGRALDEYLAFLERKGVLGSLRSMLVDAHLIEPVRAQRSFAHRLSELTDTSGLTSSDAQELLIDRGYLRAILGRLSEKTAMSWSHTELTEARWIEVCRICAEFPRGKAPPGRLALIKAALTHVRPVPADLQPKLRACIAGLATRHPLQASALLDEANRCCVALPDGEELALQVAQGLINAKQFALAAERLASLLRERIHSRGAPIWPVLTALADVRAPLCFDLMQRYVESESGKGQYLPPSLVRSLALKLQDPERQLACVSWAQSSLKGELAGELIPRLSPQALQLMASQYPEMILDSGLLFPISSERGAWTLCADLVESMAKAAETEQLVILWKGVRFPPHLDVLRASSFSTQRERLCKALLDAHARLAEEEAAQCRAGSDRLVRFFSDGGKRACFHSLSSGLRVRLLEHWLGRASNVSMLKRSLSFLEKAYAAGSLGRSEVIEALALCSRRLEELCESAEPAAKPATVKVAAGIYARMEKAKALAELLASHSLGRALVANVQLRQIRRQIDLAAPKSADATLQAAYRGISEHLSQRADDYPGDIGLVASVVRGLLEKLQSSSGAECERLSLKIVALIADSPLLRDQPCQIELLSTFGMRLVATDADKSLVVLSNLVAGLLSQGAYEAAVALLEARHVASMKLEGERSYAFKGIDADILYANAAERATAGCERYRELHRRTRDLMRKWLAEFVSSADGASHHRAFRRMFSVLCSDSLRLTPAERTKYFEVRLNRCVSQKDSIGAAIILGRLLFLELSNCLSSDLLDSGVPKGLAPSYREAKAALVRICPGAVKQPLSPPRGCLGEADRTKTAVILAQGFECWLAHRMTHVNGDPFKPRVVEDEEKRKEQQEALFALAEDARAPVAAFFSEDLIARDDLRGVEPFADSMDTIACLWARLQSLSGQSELMAQGDEDRKKLAEAHLKGEFFGAPLDLVFNYCVRLDVAMEFESFKRQRESIPALIHEIAGCGFDADGLFGIGLSAAELLVYQAGRGEEGAEVSEALAEALYSCGAFGRSSLREWFSNWLRVLAVNPKAESVAARVIKQYRDLVDLRFQSSG